MIDPIDPATVSKGTPQPTMTELAIIAKLNEVVAVVNTLHDPTSKPATPAVKP